MHFFNPIFIFLTSLKVDAAPGNSRNSQKSSSSLIKQVGQADIRSIPFVGEHKSHVPPQLMFLDPNIPFMSQITQEDFLIDSDDFTKDPDVEYVLTQLHRPQTLEKFFRTAQTVYDDSLKFYRELQSNHGLATTFHGMIEKLMVSSLSAPLTVTNLIIAITRHFRPLFKTKSEPIEELALLMDQLENEPKRLKIKLMSRFFEVYTINEIDQLQTLIKLASYGGVDKFTSNMELNKRRDAAAKLSNLPSSKPPSPTEKSKTNQSGKSSSRRSKSNTNEDEEGKDQYHVNIEENFFESVIEPHSERFRVYIVNAVTKMLILLDLFVNDDSMKDRSRELYLKLWLIHLKRLSVREKVDFDDLHLAWSDPSLYRKCPINFLYDDWRPGALTPEDFEDLRRAAVDEAKNSEEKIAVQLEEASRHKFYSDIKRGLVYVLVVSGFLGLVFLAVMKYRRFKEQSNKQEVSKFELKKSLS